MCSWTGYIEIQPTLYPGDYCHLLPCASSHRLQFIHCTGITKYIKHIRHFSRHWAEVVNKTKNADFQSVHSSQTINKWIKDYSFNYYKSNRGTKSREGDRGGCYYYKVIKERRPLLRKWHYRKDVTLCTIQLSREGIVSKVRKPPSIHHLFLYIPWANNGCHIFQLLKKIKRIFCATWKLYKNSNFSV